MTAESRIAPWQNSTPARSSPQTPSGAVNAAVGVPAEMEGAYIAGAAPELHEYSVDADPHGVRQGAGNSGVNVLQFKGVRLTRGNRWRVGARALCLVPFLSCVAAEAPADPMPGPNVASVDVSPAQPSLMVGETAQLTAVVKDADGNTMSGQTISWSVDDAGVASVSASGLLSGVGAGTAVVTATSQGISGTTSISVSAVPVATITVSPTSTVLSLSQTVQLTATPRDVSGNALAGRVVAWTSDDPTVATVDAAGLVTGASAGGATIRVTSEGVTGTASVTVTQTPSSSLTDECQTPQAGWIWCDDFEQDRLSSYFEYDNANGGFVRAAGVGAEGSSGMRAQFANGQVSNGFLHLAVGRTPQSYFRPVDAGTADYQELYWRMYLKNQPGWTGGGGFKLSRAFIFASPTSWAQAMVAHVWSGASAPKNNYLVIDPVSGTDAAGNVVTTTYNDFANFQWIGSRQGATPLFDAAHVGQWYCVEAHVVLNTPGQGNGVFELWIDDQPDASRNNLNWIDTYSGYGLNAVYFENYWNTGSIQAQERYFDNIVVSTQRIGC